MAVLRLWLISLAMVVVEGASLGKTTIHHCNIPLGVADGSLPDFRMRASSTSGQVQYGAHRARLTSKHTTSGWCSAVGKIDKEYIEIDLGQDTRLSAFETQGVLVWNNATKRYEYTHVSKFYLAYKRHNDEIWRWRQYRENEVTVTLFKGKKAVVNRYNLLSPRIARYVRLVAIEGRATRVCFKVELYGCPWKNQDGLVSYRSSQGNGRANGPGLGDLRDIGYDGRRLAYGTKRGVLSGGLGQLVDGVLGSNVPWNDTNNTAWVSWIGWRDPITEHPTVTFQFSSIRKFSKIRFHVLNQPGAEKLLFGKVVISFSNDGEYFTWKTVFEPSLQKRRMKNRAFFLELQLNHHEGKYVTCDFTFHGWWILLSEVEFESNPLQKGISSDTKVKSTSVPTLKSGPTVTSLPNENIRVPPLIPTDMVLNVKESGRPKKKGIPGDIILYASIAAGVVGAALLIAGIVLFIRRRCKRRPDETLANPLRIVNALKKNSLNRNNERSYQAVQMKLKEIERKEDIDSNDDGLKRIKKYSDVKLELKKEVTESDSESEDELKMQIRKQMEDEEDEEEVFSKLNSWKTNFGESLFKDIDTSDEMANLRPESREITLDEEKAMVLEEMRKLSENSQDPPV